MGSPKGNTGQALEEFEGQPRADLLLWQFARRSAGEANHHGEGCLAAVRAALAEGLFAHPSLYESEATGLAVFVEYLSALGGVGESPEAVEVT